MLDPAVLRAFSSSLEKLGKAAPAPYIHPIAEGADPRMHRLVNARFNKLRGALKTDGDEVGTGHKRLSIPKNRMSEDDLRTHLGFVPVKVAIPEAGQKRFESFRHPEHNVHIHDHGDVWTMHEDRHAASTMMVKKWQMEQAAAKATAAKAPSVPHGGIPASTGAHHTSRPHNAMTPVKDFVRGLPHVATEGVPGLYYYTKGRITRTRGMKDRVLEAMPKSYNRRVAHWKDLHAERQARAAAEPPK